MKQLVVMCVLIVAMLLATGCGKEGPSSAEPMTPNTGVFCHPDIPTFCTEISLIESTVPNDSGWVTATYRILYESVLNVEIEVKGEYTINIPPRESAISIFRLTLADTGYDWLRREKIPEYVEHGNLQYWTDTVSGTWKATIDFVVRYCKIKSVTKSLAPNGPVTINKGDLQ